MAVRGAAGCGFRVRVGTAEDLAWIDAMQKRQAREVGFLPRMALEGKVRKGEVLVAEADDRNEARPSGSATGEARVCLADAGRRSPAAMALPDGRASLRTPVGYLIAADRYFRRDEVGYVTQVNVAPEFRQSLVAAALLHAQFERSAYGCRLYSCWCAQDLKANEFWEAMGFVPIAFRTGSLARGKNGSPRVHVFWQKRIRAGDEVTPYWYPSQTGGGALRADRLVFPIPPGVSWREVGPVTLPELPELPAIEGAGEPAVIEEAEEQPVGPGELEYEKGIELRADGTLWRDGGRLMTRAMILEEQGASEGMMWSMPPGVTMVEELPVPVPKRRRRRRKARPAEAAIDPRLTAMARELRDRWHERPDLVALPAARHDVRRAIGAGGAPAARPLLEAA